MSKPRKLLPITEYLMEHVTARMWGYRNPTLYLDRVLRKWFGDMKWNTRHNEPMDRETALKHEDEICNILFEDCATGGLVADYLQKHFGQRTTEYIYIANGVDNPVKFTNHEANDDYPLASPITQHAGRIEYSSLDVAELVEALEMGILNVKRNLESGNFVGDDEHEFLRSAEQAIAKFKEKK